ncbi:MAG: DNA methylase [Clostridia bacterium]|nr:DNA methylase [Clostridia bacterium]
MERKYVSVDLKSFYASVECVERGLDPLDTNLVVADESRTAKTICLAVSPSLKAYGISGRARLFEVIQKVNEINLDRKYKAKNKKFTGKSYIASELDKNKYLELSYITAPPRMALYSKYSTDIYAIYLKYVAPEDIFAYSIDEVFIDVTQYLKMYKMTAKELTMTMISDILKSTGITATAGIGTNMYLCKVAMDIMAKKMKADKNGVRIAELDEMSYRHNLWNHRPITDFWRVGNGYAKKLAENGMYTMGDVALCSAGKNYERKNENLLYKLFGINAELLIDHAWGWEPCTMKDVKSYRPENNSLSSGQVLHTPYNFEKARLIVKEMTELLTLDLADIDMVTNQVVLTIGYDADNLNDSKIVKDYKGEIATDRYGRRIPKHSHGTENLKFYTSSTKIITNTVLNLYDKIINKKLLVRRINVTVNHVISESSAKQNMEFEQLDLFTDYSAAIKEKEEQSRLLKKEKNIQKAIMDIKKKFGKNAVIKGMNLKEGATTIERNNQIGGHKA